jgi:hypothetical protein
MFMVLASLCIAFQGSLVGGIQSATFKLDMNELHFEISSSSNISSRIGEDQKGTGERQFRISSDGHISSGIGEDRKQAKDHQVKVSPKDGIHSDIADQCPTDEVAQVDLSVMTLKTGDGSYPGVEWKLVFFAKKKIIKGRRSFQLTKGAGSDKWVAGECWFQGQYAKEKCAANDIGECRCETKFYPRNVDTWTLSDEPCVAELPPGEIQSGTTFSATPAGETTAIPLEIISMSKLSEYGQHPDGCPKKDHTGYRSVKSPEQTIPIPMEAGGTDRTIPWIHVRRRVSL